MYPHCHLHQWSFILTNPLVCEGKIVNFIYGNKKMDMIPSKNVVRTSYYNCINWCVTGGKCTSTGTYVNVPADLVSLYLHTQMWMKAFYLVTKTQCTLFSARILYWNLWLDVIRTLFEQEYTCLTCTEKLSIKKFWLFKDLVSHCTAS